jgi:hypothetical protein
MGEGIEGLPAWLARKPFLCFAGWARYLCGTTMVYVETRRYITIRLRLWSIVTVHASHVTFLVIMRSIGNQYPKGPINYQSAGGGSAPSTSLTSSPTIPSSPIPHHHRQPNQPAKQPDQEILKLETKKSPKLIPSHWNTPFRCFSFSRTKMAPRLLPRRSGTSTLRPRKSLPLPETTTPPHRTPGLTSGCKSRVDRNKPH